MKFYAVLLAAVLALITASSLAYSQQTFDEAMNDRMSGEPVLSPKLKLLIRDVEIANWRAVDFHNKKLVKETRKKFPDEEWLILHLKMVEEWTRWDDLRLQWERKKKVEASALIAAGGVLKVRNMDAIETQNETIKAWNETKKKAFQLNEKKELLDYSGKLSKLWSGFYDKVNTLDQAIGKLRKY